MIEKQISLNGAIVYWNLNGDYTHQPLADGFESLDLAKLCPDNRTPTAALRQALQDAVVEQGFVDALIRGRKNPEKDGFVVVQEIKGVEENAYPQMYGALVNDQGLQISPDGGDFAITVRTKFVKALYSVSAVNVARSLATAAEAMQGITLRTGGGVYWLPSSSLPRWRKLTDAVVAAGTAGSTKLYNIKTVFDESAIDALKDAVEHTITGQAQRIAEYAERPGAKERFLDARRKEAKELHATVTHWSEVLQSALPHLHAVADQCEKTVVDIALTTFPDFLSDNEPNPQPVRNSD